MPLEFIPTRADHQRNPATASLIARLIGEADALEIDDAVLYYGWPKFQDYQSVGHPVDLALLGQNVGLILIRVIDAPNGRRLQEADDSIAQAAATAVSQMIKSPALRSKRRSLKFDVTPILFSPGYDGLNLGDAEIIGSENAIAEYIRDLEPQGLTADELAEARSILEGAKALGRPNRRIVEDANQQRLAAALSALEEEIARFDAQQRHVALTNMRCPQRIRGLAGSGKTVILAMKAALAHIEDPTANILVTYYTRSLRDHLVRLITRFFRHFAEGEPDWRRVHVHHGWGRKDLEGVYREASLRAGVTPIIFSAAQQQKRPRQNPFDYVCKSLVATGLVQPHYDLILIDEGQDFPDGFYELCFFLAKGPRDEKQIVWAYDELQDVFDIRVRSAEDLYGVDEDGQPRISLARALPPNAETNDFVLPKCYRNQRDVLVLAHATGFGLYGQPVQMLQNRRHWEDVGYEVIEGDLRPGSQTVIRRPNVNSPSMLNSPADIPLAVAQGFPDVDAEVEYCVNEFCRFLDGGLEPHDLMAIAIDDRASQIYISKLSEQLALRGVESNNIIADKYSEPAFLIEGKVTLTTVYRAKGNEAAVVAVLGCDAVPLSTRSGRNRLFTAFTRTKGWLRITGIRKGFRVLKGEIDEALANVPDLNFVMPDLEQIEVIQRDLADRDARLQRAKAEMERVKGELGLSDDDLKRVIGSGRRHGKK